MLLSYIGMSEYGYPAYKDSNENIWLDINYGHPPVSLYRSSSNDLDGEPEYPIEKQYTSVEFGEVFERHPKQFEYMMLSRMESDCKYYLQTTRYAGNLYHHDVDAHISEMKRLYEQFADDEKPEWISLEQIKNYHQLMREERSNTLS